MASFILIDDEEGTVKVCGYEFVVDEKHNYPCVYRERRNVL